MGSAAERSIEQQAREAGDYETLRELAASRTVLQSHEIFYYNAFNDLDSERAHGMSLARIPRSKIVEYADECGLSAEERYELVYVIAAMDEAWLSRLAEKRKAHANSK